MSGRTPGEGGSQGPRPRGEARGAPALIEVKDLRTYFATPAGLARAVDGVSFRIDEGDTFALVGESGCGKTVTALSIIQLVPGPAGFIAGGEILLRGRNVIPLPERQKREIRGKAMAMVFQEAMTSLNPVMPIGDQIAESVKLHQGQSSREARAVAAALLERVGLGPPGAAYHEYPHALSGGQRQRVMIAIALAGKPDLLIADEPTTALDVTTQQEILGLIRRLQEEMDAAVLLITHNLALVHQNAARVGVMYAGKMVETAPTRTLFRNPLHPYTVKLLRSLPGLAQRGRPLDVLTGTLPPATAYPAGCRFAGRCPSATEGCKRIEPRLREREHGHLVACHLQDPALVNPLDSGPAPVEPAAPAPRTAPPGEREVLLEVRGLESGYPRRRRIFHRATERVRAVDGVDFAIRRGSTLALVGESGCGKTTVARSILRLKTPAAGEILFKGRNLAGLSRKELKPYRRRLQIIFQDPCASLDPRMRVGEIIEEGLRSLEPRLDRRARRRRAAGALDRVGLAPEVACRYPHEFSGGQRQRIGIARVLAVDPEFLVCDEATSALDVSVQAQILNLLKSLQQDQGLTILFITHDFSVVAYMADDVAVMYRGRIVESGTVEAILSHPRHDYTRALLRAVPRIEPDAAPA